jgi:hypothetical protein
MGLLEIVDQTFRLYRRNFWLFLAIAAVVYLPLGAVQGVPVLGPLAALIFAPLYMVAAAALTKAISDRYLGQSTSVGEAYRHIGRRFWGLLFTTILAYLFMVSGIVLLGVGLIVFAFWIAFVPQVFVIEGKQYFPAIWRSRFLIGKGTWGEVFVLGMIVGALTLIIQGALGAAVGVSIMSRSAETMPMHAAILMGLMNALVVPIGQAATVLLYYDSRMRKEGFDLEMLAKEMGVAMAAGPAAPPDQAGSGGASAEAGQQM